MGRKQIQSFLLITAALSVGGAADAEQGSADVTDRLFAAPVDGGARRWQAALTKEIALRDAPSGDELAEVTISDGMILTNLGCVEHSGALWCEVRPLHGGPNGFVSADHLEPVAGPDGIIATGPDDSAKRAKRKSFDETQAIPCAQEQGQELGTCSASVARSGGGDATVSATFGNGFARLLFFAHGEFLRANSTMSGVGTDIDWAIDAGVYTIRVDDQRFEIPASFLLGL